MMVKQFKYLFFIILIFINSLSIAAIPDIKGIWSGKGELINWQGQNAVIEYTIHFTDIKNNYIKGDIHWQAEKGHKYSVGDAHHHKASEKFIGTYDAKHNAFYLVETTEQALIKVDVISPEKINLIYLEAGKNAVVFNNVLEKQQP